MTVRIIDRSWYIDLRFNHKRYRKRSPENTKRGAEAYEATLRQKFARGEEIEKIAQATEQDQLFEQFAWRWFEQYVKSNNKYSEQRTKRYILRAFLVPFFGKIPIGQITAYHIEQYKAQAIKEGVKNKTINNRLTVLKKCLSTAYDWLQLERTPPKLTWLKCSPYQMDYLSPGECESLLSHADDAVYEMILMAVRTGMRQGELKGLQWPSIDWENRSVAIRHSRDDRMKMLVSPKSNRERHVPLDIDVYEALYKRKRETGYVFSDTNKEPFNYHRMERRLTKACEEAGLRKVGWHTLRHTFASHLAAKGVPMTAVQQLMGHSNITTTMRYAHLAPSTLRAAVDMLNPKEAIKADFGQPVGSEWLREQRKEIIQKSASVGKP
jgi:integrase